MYSLKKILPSLDNIRTELKQSIGYAYAGYKGRLRKYFLHMKFAYTRCWDNTWVCTIITIWVRPLVRPLAVRENDHSSWPQSILTTFACIMSFHNHWHAKSLFFEEGFIQNWQTFNVGRAYYYLLISLNIKLIYSLVLNMFQVKEWSYPMLGTMRDSYPTHEKSFYDI